MRGAPKGNTNSAKGREWSRAIELAIDSWPVDNSANMAEKGGLHKAAFAFVNKMMLDEDISFFREFGDRIDGKAKQTVETTVSIHEQFIDDLE